MPSLFVVYIIIKNIDNALISLNAANGQVSLTLSMANSRTSSRGGSTILLVPIPEATRYYSTSSSGCIVPLLSKESKEKIWDGLVQKRKSRQNTKILKPRGKASLLDSAQLGFLLSVEMD